jgi:hypothetical protein
MLLYYSFWVVLFCLGGCFGAGYWIWGLSKAQHAFCLPGFLFVCLLVLEFELRTLSFDFKLLEPHPSPFCFYYFSGSVFITFILGGPGLQSSYLYFLCSWDDRCTLSHPDFYWLRWALPNFLRWLAWNHDPPE